jgi:hypothetical protein
MMDEQDLRVLRASLNSLEKEVIAIKSLMNDRMAEILHVLREIRDAEKTR